MASNDTDRSKTEVLQGTLEMLILKVLALQPMHGYGVSRRLEQITGGVFRVNAGSFFPALYRLEEDGLVTSEWGRSENNRRAKFYRLTEAGRRRLRSEERQWQKVSLAIAKVLEAT